MSLFNHDSDKKHVLCSHKGWTRDDILMFMEDGWRPPLDAANRSDSLTISMILVFFPALFFFATMYCARATPPNRAHRLALAAAPTFTTAVLSMAVASPTDSPHWPPSVCVCYTDSVHTHTVACPLARTRWRRSSPLRVNTHSAHCMSRSGEPETER